MYERPVSSIVYSRFGSGENAREIPVDSIRFNTDDAEHYGALVERAVDFVLERSAGVPEDMLVTHVFGSATSPQLWRDLLRTVLVDNDSIALGVDGVWRSREPSDRSEFPAEYVVVDVETTGLKPRYHRITEVAVIRVSDDGDRFVWTTLVNPDRRIPRQISKLTGIDPQMVATAPRFGSIAQTILDLVGDALIVGHNVDFDIGFLNAELHRCSLPRLINPTLDTLALADAMLPDLRRLSLTEVARHLGVGQSKAHRAAADAETTLSVLSKLRDVAADQGDASLDTLASLAGAKRRRKRAARNVSRGRSVLDRSHLDGMPNAPGVYIMRDNGGRVIYVGKAKDLRKRVSSYYSQPLGYTRKMDGLLESIERIEFEVTGSELEALVVESQLIRRYRPRFNSQQRNVEQYVFIRVDTSNPWPTVTTARDRSEDGAAYFGPFKSARHARDAVRLVNDVLPLRTCRRSFRTARSLGSPCIELSLRRCLGPCVGAANPDVYRGFVSEVLEFLNGDTDRLLPVLQQRLESAASNQDFERAKKLRDQIQRLNRLTFEQAHIDVVAKAGDLLIVLPSKIARCRQVWHLVNGVRWASHEIADDADPSSVADRLERSRQRSRNPRSPVVMNHHTVDEASLISRWVRNYGERDAIVRWNPDTTAETIAKIVMSVRPLDPDDKLSGEETIANDG